MIIITGSCSLEAYEEVRKQAIVAEEYGYLRAMLWKPRTTKHAYQGIGEAGIKILSRIHDEFPTLTFVTEVMSIEHINILLASKLPFIFQVGTRNAQNYELLKYIGKLKGQTILYKRGMWMTIDEYIAGAEYLEPENNNIWLCLRGIRGFDTSMRNIPDIGAILVLKERLMYNDKFKIIFDPSHAGGYRSFVKGLSMSAIACGADGLEIETHSNPDDAISDAAQTISFDMLQNIINQLNCIHKVI